jgi:hypothetical protein
VNCGTGLVSAGDLELLEAKLALYYALLKKRRDDWTPAERVIELGLGDDAQIQAYLKTYGRRGPLTPPAPPAAP